MQSILDDIYYGRYQRRFVPTPQYQKAAEAMKRDWDEAREAFGFERVDQLWSSLMAVAALEGADDFREGFRLGAAVMLEALGER